MLEVKTKRILSFRKFQRLKIGFIHESDKVYQLLAHGWWFSLGTLASSTTKTGLHDIAEIPS
jgi:hypothetical protein